MPSGDFRAVFLPYCIQKLDDGRFVVLNRDYKPLGFKTREHIVYEDYPICVNMPGLTSRVAEKLSWKESPETKEIFLYNDGSVPTRSAGDMNRYLDRLARLAKLKIR